MIIPEETPLTEPYWEAARQGKVALQRCSSCDNVWHPPQPICPNCRSKNYIWFNSAGFGVVYSHTTVRHAVHAAVKESVPYIVCLIELDEGPRVISNLIVPIEQATSGARVEMRLGPTPGGPELPVAYPIDS
jgi:uncharacterized OB-fold protein